MPITAPYISAKNLLFKLNQIDFNRVKSVLDTLQNIGLSDIVGIYKASVKSYTKSIVAQSDNAAATFALAGAVESDFKNAQLTTFIAGVLVNPVFATNLVEQEALLTDGGNTAREVQIILDDVNSI